MRKTLKKVVAIAVLATLSAAATAQTEQLDGVEVTHECDTTWNLGYGGISIYSRQMHRIDIVYPSVDVHGNAVRLSGSIAIPGNVYDGSSPVDGTVLYNRYMQTVPEGCPTRGFAEGEAVVLCNPLNPNWILVESDFYGFGVTAGHFGEQYYVYDDANGHASIDCLLAARKVLEQRGIDQGKYLFNVGVSSGGYDCLATQRVRDMYYKDVVRFDKTLAAAAPFDVAKAYMSYIDQKDNPKQDVVFGPIVLNTFNRHDNLGFTPQQMFTDKLAAKFDSWFNSGRYTTEQLRDSLKDIGIKTFTDAIQPALLSYSSDEYKKLKAAFDAHSLQVGWDADPDQSYYYQHYAHDAAVPSASGRVVLDFLTKKGYKKSLVPELTNLTTCMYIMGENHSISGIQFLLRVAATLAAYPVLFYDGELNTHYYDLVKDATPMGIVKKLEEKGIDVGKALGSLTGGDGEGGMDFFSLMTTLNKYDQMLQEHGTSLGEVMLIADDSGISLSDIMEIVSYLNSKSTTDTPTDVAASRSMRQKVDRNLVGDYYYNSLLDWLRENKVELSELKIGL